MSLTYDRRGTTHNNGTIDRGFTNGFRDMDLTYNSKVLSLLLFQWGGHLSIASLQWILAIVLWVYCYFDGQPSTSFIGQDLCSFTQSPRDMVLRVQKFSDKRWLKERSIILRPKASSMHFGKRPYLCNLSKDMAGGSNWKRWPLNMVKG